MFFYEQCAGCACILHKLGKAYTSFNRIAFRSIHLVACNYMHKFTSHILSFRKRGADIFKPEVNGSSVTVKAIDCHCKSDAEINAEV